MSQYSGKTAEEIYQYDGSVLLPKTIIEGLYSNSLDESGPSLIRSLFSVDTSCAMKYDVNTGKFKLLYDTSDFIIKSNNTLSINWAGHAGTVENAKKLVDNNNNTISTKAYKFNLQYFDGGIPKCDTLSYIDTLFTSSNIPTNSILYVSNSTAISGEASKYKTTIGSINAPTSANTYLKWTGSNYTWAEVGGGGTTLTIAPAEVNDKYYVIGTDSTTSGSQEASTLYKAGYNTSSGVYFCNNNLFQTSDETLKTFINDIDVDLDNLKTIKKGEFYWKNDPDKKVDLGVIAQSLEALYPQIVSEDNGVKSVSYNKLGVIALAAIDKLYDRIRELEKEVEELKNNK